MDPGYASGLGGGEDGHDALSRRETGSCIRASWIHAHHAIWLRRWIGPDACYCLPPGLCERYVWDEKKTGRIVCIVRSIHLVGLWGGRDSGHVKSRKVEDRTHESGRETGLSTWAICFVDPGLTESRRPV